MQKRILPFLGIISLWILLVLSAFLKPTSDISLSERRKLEQFPELTASSLLSGRYMEQVEAAAPDQFPLREAFRQLRASFFTTLYGQLDSHGIYQYDGYLEKLTGPVDLDSLASAAEKIKSLQNAWFPDSQVYFSIVPDKGYFLPEDSIYPTMDYDALFETMESLLPSFHFIDLSPTLSLSDYYRTDTHWRQENLADTAKLLAEALGATLSGSYETETVKTDFLGVYAGQSALPVAPETMGRLTNAALENCTVYNWETGETGGIWDKMGLSARDPYDYYLFGAASLLTIENPAAPNGQDLIVFRDSFGSSLIPLLAEGFTRSPSSTPAISSPSLLGNYVDFEGKDVLFLYSTGLLNQSAVLQG